jgi:hypothetical protein
VNWRTYLPVALVVLAAAIIATLVLAYTGDLQVNPSLRLWATVFIGVVVLLLLVLAYFNTAEARLRRFLITLLSTTGAFIALKVVVSWSISVNVPGYLEFLLSQGETGAEIVALIVSLGFIWGAIFLFIWKCQTPRYGYVSGKEWGHLEFYRTTVDLLISRVKGENSENTTTMQDLLQKAVDTPKQIVNVLKDPSTADTKYDLLKEAMNQAENEAQVLIERYGDIKSLLRFTKSIDQIREVFDAFGE